MNLETCVQLPVIGPIYVLHALEVYARTPINVTPGYKELRVPVQIVGESEARTTPFSMGVRGGTKVTLEVPKETPDRYYVFRRFDVYVGEATTPTQYPGTFDSRRNIYSLTLTINQKTKVIAVYEAVLY